MSDTKILREYLVKLGFQVDPVTHNRFDWALQGVDKRLLKLGGVVAGVASGAAAMANSFAKQMEQMYYASRLAQSSAGNIRQAGIAGEQIGLNSERVTAAITDMARAMRANPGLQGLLESLGIKVEGRDMSDVMRDMVGELRKMPFYVGSQFANLFGMDPDTFLLFSEGLEKYDAARKAAAETDRKAGFDADEAAKAAVRYANALTQLGQRLSLIRDTMSVQLLPVIEDMVTWLTKALDSLNALLNGRWSPGPELKKSLSGWSALMNGDWRKAVNIWGEMWNEKTPAKSAAPGSAQNAQKPTQAPQTQARQGGSATQAMFASLEARHGLPAGLLDRMWAKESNRGDPKFMLSPKGAQGHFGFMPPTAKEWGVNPNDLNSSAEGAAKYMQFLLQRYKGDTTKALAAYNWGLGNVDKYGLGRMPAETQDYVKIGQGLSVSAPTTIIVQGAPDPERTADAVERRLTENLGRNLQTVVQ